MTILKYVAPADLHSVWPQIRVGVDAIIARAKERFIPEDVYASIKTGAAQLFTAPDGFMVLQNQRNEFTNQPTLHVWLTYHANNEDISEETFRDLLKLADNIGAKEITFSSPRRWDRYIDAQIVSHNFIIEVKP
jgi:hypothetical protein